MKKVVVLAAILSSLGCQPRLEQKIEFESKEFYFFPSTSITDSTLIGEKAYPKIEEERLWIVGYGFGFNEEAASKRAFLDAIFRIEKLTGKEVSILSCVNFMYKLC